VFPVELAQTLDGAVIVALGDVDRAPKVHVETFCCGNSPSVAPFWPLAPLYNN
jgi:hypothetical protein